MSDLHVREVNLAHGLGHLTLQQNQHQLRLTTPMTLVHILVRFGLRVLEHLHLDLQVPFHHGVQMGLLIMVRLVRPELISMELVLMNG